jgi:hypothetical protein
VVPGGGGSIGVQIYFQTETGYQYQVPGTLPLPVDGQFHDLTVSLNSIVDRDIVQTFGVNLANHPNDVFIDVDLVRFEVVDDLFGDYNGNGNVDAADYVVWRKALNTDAQLPNDPTLGVTPEDYGVWFESFGESIPGGGGTSLVPEPRALTLALVGCLIGLARGGRQDGSV